MEAMSVGYMVGESSADEVLAERRAGARVPALRVQLLGWFAVWVDGTLIDEGGWQRRKVTRVVKLLAFAERHSIHREQIQAQLWPDFDASSASQNLHHTLYPARRWHRTAGGGTGRAHRTARHGGPTS
jgi:hypothetical protein